MRPRPVPLATAIAAAAVIAVLPFALSGYHQANIVTLETGGAVTVFLATWIGVPVSTTHTITGAIIGVGAAKRASAVRWGVAKDIVIAWVITLPMSAAIAALGYHAARLVLK